MGIVGARIAGSRLGGGGRLVMEVLIRCLLGRSIIMMTWKLVFIARKLVMKHDIVETLPFSI